MKIRVELDYPDDLIEKHGEADAAGTLAACLAEVYPGTDGDVWNPDVIEVVVGETVNAKVYTFGAGA